jgi:hypothetical protein
MSSHFPGLDGLPDIPVTDELKKNEPLGADAAETLNEIARDMREGNLQAAIARAILLNERLEQAKKRKNLPQN